MGQNDGSDGASDSTNDSDGPNNSDSTSDSNGAPGSGGNGGSSGGGSGSDNSGGGNSGDGDGGGSGGGNNSGGGGGSGGSGSGGSDGGNDGGSQGDETPGLAEKVVMVVSILFTVALVGYVGWQIVAAPAGQQAPEVRVVDTETLSNGSVAVTVELTNRENVGLISVTVESACTSPPTALTFSFVPVDSTQKGTLVCPPGTNDSSVSVSSWIEA